MRGFSMIEVLVALVIVVLGLLGLAGLQVRMQQAEFESYQRAQALILLQDIVDRIQLHRVTAPCFQFTTNTTTGAPYLGNGATFTPACSISDSDNNTQANDTMNEWSSLLQGAAESGSAGAMVGARGCVSYDPTTEVDAGSGAIPGTGIYTVVISWKGTIETIAPPVNCGNDNTLYVAETRRRAISTTFRLGALK